MIKGGFELWWFPKWSHGSTKKNRHFLDLEGITTFLWFPTIVAKKLGNLNKWRLLAPPYMTAPWNAWSGSATGQKHIHSLP